MKLTFKDLSQQKFTIEIEPSETIADVKSKVAAERKSDASLLKLIYSGKILQDDKTVESYKIEEKGFIVVMTNKPKPAAASSAAPPATPAPAAVPETPAAPQAPAPVASSNTAAPGTPSPAPAAQGGQAFGGDSGMAVGMEDRNRAIADMESMGFPRADIDRAMRAAFYNADRAVEYLLNGIPESALQEERSRQIPASAAAGNTQPQTQQQQPTQQQGGEESLNLFDQAAQAGGRGGATGGNRGGESRGGAGGNTAAANLDFLRNNPQFQQLRQVVQQQPQMLEPILQQVAAGNPQVAQIIAQHPDQFMQLLAEDADDDAALPPGAQPISVTEEERDAIERLCRLGFEREMVIQAYFACDKNEELAANFLFDQPDEPDEQ